MTKYPYTLNEKQLELSKKMLEWLKGERDTSGEMEKHYNEIRTLKRVILEKRYYKNHQKLLNEIREMYIQNLNGSQ